jgi:KDO2-lipid IV(A) lauroyltransferase
MEPRRSIGNTLLDLVAVTITAIIGVLPWRVATGIGAGFGRIAGVVVRRKAPLMIENLNNAGSRDPERDYWRSFANTGRSLFEMLWSTSRSPETVLSRVRVDGLDSVRDAYDEGNGVLLASGHFGNWELVSLAMAQGGYPVAVIARPLRVPRVEARIVAFRERGGVRTLMRGVPGSSVAAYRWLARGRVLGCMMDRVSSISRVLVPFLGKAMNVPLGPAEYAFRAKAAVILGAARRLADGTTHVTFRRLPTEGVTEPAELAGVVGAALEEEIRARPEQWYWISRRQPGWEGVATIRKGPRTDS